MALIADILLISGAFGAALYCLVLSRRLSRLSDLDGGVGKAIADLNERVGELSRALQEARSAADGAASPLDDLTERAEAVAALLEARLAELPGVNDERGAGSRESRGAETKATRERPTRAGVAPVDRPASTPMPTFIRGRATRTAAE